jgi:hypothetical protein
MITDRPLSLHSGKLVEPLTHTPKLLLDELLGTGSELELEELRSLEENELEVAVLELELKLASLELDNELSELDAGIELELEECSSELDSLEELRLKTLEELELKLLEARELRLLDECELILLDELPFISNDELLELLLEPVDIAQIDAKSKVPVAARYVIRAADSNCAFAKLKLPYNFPWPTESCFLVIINPEIAASAETVISPSE